MASDIFDIIVRVGLAAATTVLFFLVASAYRRLKSTKMLLITTGFGVFWFHALVTLPELFNEAYDTELNESVHLLLVLIGLIFILIGTLKE
jgi:hypothetical protein